MLGPVDRLGGLVVRVLAHRAGHLVTNPGPGENFFSKLLFTTYQTVILKAKFSSNLIIYSVLKCDNYI